MKLNTTLLLSLLLSASGATLAAPLGTAFTYQGRLNDGTNAANGLYDLDFALFDVPTGGSPLGLSVTLNGHPVSNGLFTVMLDFGTERFNGDARWLQIQVRTNGSRLTPYTPLSPRQALASSPYALYAPNAGTALAMASGAVSTLSLAPGAVTSDKIADGTLTAADLSPALASNTFWRLAGNAGTQPGSHFLGTTDNQPVEIRVQGQRALRLEPGGSGAPNLVGGSASNRVTAGVIGATIAGGGNGLGSAHRIEANYGTIGGGGENTLQTGANFSIIAGGYGNTIQTSAWQSVIGGGGANTIHSNAYISTIGGGSDNLIQANAKFSTIAGGDQNTIQADASRATIGGGGANTIQTNAPFTTIGGGYTNIIQPNAPSSTIGGGYGNTIWTFNSTIGGGRNNTIEAGATDSTIAGGSYNTIMDGSAVSTIAGGSQNAIYPDASDSTIGGGGHNAIETFAHQSTIAGGDWNLIEFYATCATIGGGFGNQIESGSGDSTVGATIGGGVQNLIQNAATNSTLAGGFGNVIQTFAAASSIGGGRSNRVESEYLSSSTGATIAGGQGNTIQRGGGGCTIGGGERNTIQASADCATVPGGFANLAGDFCSFAAGCKAQALHSGSFVWADTTSGPYWSTGDHQFCVRATGGVQLFPGTSLYCGTQTRQMLNLWSTNYGLGVQGDTLYFRANDTAAFAWYLGGGHRDGYLDAGGGVRVMSLDAAGLSVGGVVNATAFNPSSDRNLKEHFAAVSPREMLDKVTALPISRWNFKGDAATSHMSPMAQDFHAAFALGTDEKHIATVDADGVALAAIQGLNQKLEEQVKTKDAEIQELKRRVEKLERLLLRGLDTR